MNKKILKVRTPFRALLHSVFYAEMDAFSQQVYQQKAKSRKMGGFTNKLKDKLSFLPAKVIQQVISVVFLCGIFGFLGFGIGTGLPVDGLARFISLSLFMTSLLFSFAPCMSSFFMSDDVLYYMTMPFNDGSIIKAKILQFAYSNALMDMSMFIAMFIGAAWSGHYGLSLVLRGLIYVVLCCVSSKIVLLFFIFILISKVKFFRNRDRFVKVVSSAMLVFFLLVGVGSQIFGRLADANVAQTTYTLLSTSTWGLILSNICNIFTLPGFFIPFIFSAQTLIGFLVLAGVTILLLALTYCLVKYTSARYLVIIRNLQGGNSVVRKKALSKTEINRQLMPRTAKKSFAYVDKVLVKRTPNLFTNFVLTPLLMPFYILACALVGAIVASLKEGSHLSQIGTFIANHRQALVNIRWNNVEILYAMAGVTFFLLLMNTSSVATAEILRDGRNFIFYRTLPLNMRDYLWVKLRRSIVYQASLISVLVVLIMLLAVALFSLPLTTALLIIVYIVCMQVSLQIVSLIAGAVTAKFDFDLETELLRQLKGFSRLLVNLGSLIAIALPVALVAFISQGFTILPTGETSNTFLFATIWQLIYTVILLTVYFGPLAKYLARKRT